MVICSTLKDTEEMSVEYAYTPNELAYSQDIEKIKEEIKLLSDPEIILQKQSQLKTLEKMLRDEQVAFVNSIDTIANLLQQLIFKGKD